MRGICLVAQDRTQFVRINQFGLYEHVFRIFLNFRSSAVRFDGGRGQLLLDWGLKGG